MSENLAPEGWGWTDEHQEHLEAMLAARKAEDEHIRWLVSKELEKFLPEYVEAEQEAAEKVQACYAALRDPETDLAAIDKQIGEVEGQCVSWEAKLTDNVAEMRVEAHTRWSAWNNELRMLYADREAQLAVVEPLRDAHAAARAKLNHATNERSAVEMNISDFPYWGLGHKTDAYQVFRANSGHLVPVLLAGDEAHMEWLAAFDWMDRLCIRSGYRSEGRIPTLAEETKLAVENYLAASSSTQQAPSMGEIMSQTQAHAKSQRRVPPDHWEYAPQVNPVRANPPDPAMRYQPLRNIKT